MHARALLPLLLCGGCSLIFDDEAPDLPLVGAAASLEGLPRVYRGPSDLAAVLRGVDGDEWLALYKLYLDNPLVAAPVPLGNEVPAMAVQSVRLARLRPPEWEETLDADAAYLSLGALFLLDYPSGTPGMGPVRLTIRRPGQEAPVLVREMPESRRPFALPSMTIGGEGEVYLYWTPDGPRFEMHRTDGSFSTSFAAIQLRDDSWTLPLTFFDRDGELLFIHRACYGRVAPGTCNQLTVHSTRDGTYRVLGRFERPAALATVERLVLSCDEDGLRAVGFDGGPIRVLDETPCLPYYVVQELAHALARGQRSVTLGRVLYVVQGAVGLDVRSALLDGSAPPETLFRQEAVPPDPEAMNPVPQSRMIIAASPLAVAWSNPPVENYFGINGWIGDVQFMERGGAVAFGAGGRRVRWLEHAARRHIAGDLLSAELADLARPLRLARNVRDFEEIDDGRVLAASNQSFVGWHNRVILVDEAAGHAQRVAEGASGFILVPWAGKAVVELPTVYDSNELVLVDLPRRSN